MTDWTDGYVSDIVYTGGFYREQSPSHLDLACSLAGIEPAVRPGEPFTYCELGCGVGDTAMLVAATEPRGRVWGFDFNPAHVAQARAVAARTGLDNVRFEEASFQDLAEGRPSSLPDFDYVTLHGVWSWISPASQAQVVAFLKQRLRPGGVVCISYNAMPGWTGGISLQRLIHQTAQGISGDSAGRVVEAVAAVRRMVDSGAKGIDEKLLESAEKAVKSGNAAYLCHEYLNDHWRPFFFAEVAATLAPAKLNYVCSARLRENFTSLFITPEQRAMADGLPQVRRETVLDLFRGATFRSDIFVRGPRPVSVMTQPARLRAHRLTMVQPGRFASLEMSIPQGQATLSATFYGPAMATLAERVASVGELVDAAAPGTAPIPEEIVGLLAGGRQVLGLPGEPDVGTVARARRYNRARLAIYNEDAQTTGWMAAAGAASAIPVRSVVEMLVYEAVAAAEENGGAVTADAIVPAVRTLLQERHMHLADEPDADQSVAEDVGTIIREWVPIWRRIGAL